MSMAMEKANYLADWLDNYYTNDYRENADTSFVSIHINRERRYLLKTIAAVIDNGYKKEDATLNTYVERAGKLGVSLEYLHWLTEIDWSN